MTRVLRVVHVVEMKESRPSTRAPTRLSQAVRDHGGAGQLHPRTVIRSNTNTVPYFRGAVALEKYHATKIVSLLPMLWRIFRALLARVFGHRRVYMSGTDMERPKGRRRPF